MATSLAHDPSRLRELFGKAAPPDLPLAFKAMFGGILAYVDGKPLASLSDVGLALKCAGSTHAALLALPGAARLRYAADQPESKSYVVVPKAMMTNEAALRPWIARCASELVATPKKTRSRT